MELASSTRSSHIGGVLSMMDIMTLLWFEEMSSEDHFILSKGHAALGLYAVLAERGVITESDLQSYYQPGSTLIAHASHLVAGVEVSTGSLGHGPAIAAGMALVLKEKRPTERVFCLLGDGECQEGSVWEALTVIARLCLNNLCLIVDYNQWQGASDPVYALLPLPRLVAMLQATGLLVTEVNGHDFEELREALSRPHEETARVIVARTTKGKGVSYMEDNFTWHYRSPNSSELEVALRELA